MTAFTYEGGPVVRGVHEGYGGGWPSHVTLSLAPDQRGFAAPAWVWRWATNDFVLARRQDEELPTSSLCLWFDGIDDEFELRSALPTAAGSSFTVVALISGKGAPSLTSVEVRSASRFDRTVPGSTLELETPDGSRVEARADATGNVDLADIAPALLRAQNPNAFVLASDAALRRRPRLLAVVTAAAVERAFADDRVVPSVRIAASRRRWRYFVLPRDEVSSANWQVRCLSGNCTFSPVRRKSHGDRFSVSPRGLPWLEFPGGARGLGFKSSSALPFGQDPAPVLDLGQGLTPLRLPLPAAKTSNLASDGQCLDVFIHV